MSQELHRGRGPVELPPMRVELIGLAARIAADMLARDLKADAATIRGHILQAVEGALDGGAAPSLDDRPVLWERPASTVEAGAASVVARCTLNLRRAIARDARGRTAASVRRIILDIVRPRLDEVLGADLIPLQPGRTPRPAP